MRLIDAEHLIKKAEQEKKDGLLEDDELEIIYYELSDEPIVDAVPVRHGKWMLYYDIEQGRALRCSECKMVFWVGDGREGNFCPNCGAKMDGKKNETV